MTAFSGVPVYCSREDVKRALDSGETARNNDVIDRLIDGSARDIDDACARYFYPRAATLYWDWPDVQMGRSWRLWLDRDELLSLTSVSTGGVTVPTGSINLEPNRSGPPYTRIELSLATNYAFYGLTTPQRAIGVTGVFGFTNATDSRTTTLSSGIGSSDTSLTVANGAAAGVGDTLLIGSEYVQVIDRSWLSTGQSGSLAASSTATSLAVSDGTVFSVGETLMLDTERLLITDIVGNTLLVRRAFDGSTLASHSSATVYASRTLSVTRATLGTTAASHSSGATVARHAPPSLIRQYNVALVLDALQQEGSAYQAVQQRSRQLKASNSGRDALTQLYPLDGLRDRVISAYGRQSRIRVI